jgi:hypothetical protein
MLKRLLFETRFGEMLLTLLERRAGLAVVDVNWLSHQRPAVPGYEMRSASESKNPPIAC